jgi:acetyl esterase/lipase
MKLYLFALLLVCGLPLFAADLQAPQKIYRIMPVGDSITEGGPAFSVYSYPLWEKLVTAGYLVEYVGSKKSATRIGPLAHEGYSGKNAEFLATVVPKNFEQHPADIVLLHAGHNYTVEEAPVPKIITATESMIAGFRRTNPQVTVLLAKVICSGKLPKYSYIPQLNEELGKLALRLNKPGQPVVIVDQAEGFDPATDTIADHVHPNAKGAEKMAQRWFETLTPLLDKPPKTYQPKIIPYKKTPQGDLTLHVFTPENSAAPQARPVIVFFFGGGWTNGTPLQFYPECAHFAERGMVAISADYRIDSVNHTTPFESVADGKSAIRWIRKHAQELGIDPKKIVAAGASAGGQVAAATGTLSGLDEASEDASISSHSDALILWYPVVDNGPSGYGDAKVKERYQEISPLHNISSATPPTLFFLGTKDQHIPVATAEDFKAQMERAGVRCDLQLFEGAGHPLYSYQKGESPLRQQTLAASDAFLSSLGF